MYCLCLPGPELELGKQETNEAKFKETLTLRFKWVPTLHLPNPENKFLLKLLDSLLLHTHFGLEEEMRGPSEW